MKHISIFVTLFIFATIILGCGGVPKPDNFPATVPFTVIVNNSGTPEKGVNVVLIPEGAAAWTVSGTTDDTGKAVLAASQGTYIKPGSPVGKFKAVLNKTVRPAGEVSPEEYMKMTEGQRQEYGAKMEAEMKALPAVVPKVLTSPATTTLTIDVSESAKETTVDLKDYK